MFKSVHEVVGRIDVVCANAGVSEIGKLVGKDEVDESGEPKKPNLKTLDINLTGTLFCKFSCNCGVES